jgi:hypothetical protein
MKNSAINNSKNILKRFAFIIRLKISQPKALRWLSFKVNIYYQISQLIKLLFFRFQILFI